MQKKTSCVLVLGLLACGQLVAQEKNEDKDKNIGTEVVDVVKQYNPTIGDANKINIQPRLDDSITTVKRNVNYTIFSVPVASTFTPAKGKATGLKKAPKEELYNTFASVGLGNYSAALVDFYTSIALNREENLDLSLNHNSSQGGIDEVVLDDRYFDTSLEGGYRMQDRYMSWGVNGGFRHQIYNWYGIPQELYSESQIDGIDERQAYYTAELGGNIDFKDSFFKGAEAKFRRFWDGFSSGENRLILQPSFELPISTEYIDLGVKLDFLQGNFKSNYAATDDLKYSNLTTTISPGLVILEEDLKIDLGANIVYRFDIEGSDHDFFIYPNVKASYNLVEEFVIPYAGVTGELTQNNYHDFVQGNTFVSPTLNMVPSDEQYNAFVGVKGKFMQGVGYNLKGSYSAINNNPLYRSNAVNYLSNEEGYSYGNSFGVVYDDMKILSVMGEVNVDINRNFNLGLNAEFLDYNTDEAAEAWNLPTIKGSVFMDYQIGEKWLAGANLFYVGERKDLIDTPMLLDPTVVSIDGYFDINARLAYQVSKPLSAFIRANNIAGNEYDRWVNYPVQGLQIMAGASYKFDL
ncbi:TonB-dependent receptor [Robertkochia solimangrovi]|uniref:TonB-dependent receptor n=1 Tax=Robertkochia solimangrovi TaxID=2213046 RepID=UPI00117CF265|nr:TonB-dependent receptor [Robertkochia solimangrovi]TRZ42727.1 TonB-dependent receptor [Robertkochia solimangrovi]